MCCSLSKFSVNQEDLEDIDLIEVKLNELLYAFHTFLKISNHSHVFLFFLEEKILFELTRNRVWIQNLGKVLYLVDYQDYDSFKTSETFYRTAKQFAMQFAQFFIYMQNLSIN